MKYGISYIFRCALLGFACLLTAAEPIKNAETLSNDLLIPISDMLDIALTPTEGEETSPEVSKIYLLCFNKIRSNEYHAAAEILIEGLNKYPGSFALQTWLAAVLGDYAGQLPGAVQERMVEKSKQIFEKLAAEVGWQSKREQFYFNNEYSYRYALHREQYENGLAMVDYYFDRPDMESYGYKGYYFQGVGAANYAKKLLLKSNELLAREYARKALMAWAQYFSYCNNYYNAYVHYGLALGILGETNEMMRALQRGAQLIHVDLEYYEFKEVIEFIHQ